MYLIYILLFFILFFVLFLRTNKLSYRLIVWMHVISFILQFGICLYFKSSSFVTVFNILFICINLFLIISPWSRYQVRLSCVDCKDRFLLFARRYMRPILLVNFVISLVLGVIIYTVFPSAKEFKQDGYLELYETIPYFGNFFRYAYTTQLFGYLAVPVFFNRLVVGDKKEAWWWFIASLSSLVSGIAFFSRANMLSFALVYFFFYLTFRSSLGSRIQRRISRLVKYTTIMIIVSFILMSYSRFSRMDYLAERIPRESVVQDITTYYLLYYGGQSFPYSITSLEEYSSEKCLNGSITFYNLYQVLGFFHLIDWDSSDAIEKRAKVMSELSDKFLGYTAGSVYDLGYIGTIIMSFVYWAFVRRMSKARNNANIKSLMYIAILIQIPLNSIFYNIFSSAIMTLLFLLFMTFIHKCFAGLYKLTESFK